MGRDLRAALLGLLLVSCGLGCGGPRGAKQDAGGDASPLDASRGDGAGADAGLPSNDAAQGDAGCGSTCSEAGTTDATITDATAADSTSGLDASLGSDAPIADAATMDSTSSPDVLAFDSGGVDAVAPADSAPACVPSCSAKSCGASDGCSGTCAVGSGCCAPSNACPVGFSFSGGLCVPKAPGAKFGTIFGALYEPWHCPWAMGSSGGPALDGGYPIYDNAKILGGDASFGPISPINYDWKSEPLDGYYCLSQRDDVLRKHAIELRDAGIAFVMVDSSNQPSSDPTYAVLPGSMILDPLAELLKVWSTVPGAPRVVPFVPLVQGTPSPMVDAMMSAITAYPKMPLIVDGKPLFLLTANTALGAIDQAHLSQLTQTYSYRLMWQQNAPGFAAGTWSFMSWCQNLPAFNAAQANATCDQLVTMNNGVPEQIAVSPALNSYIFSIPAQATPRYDGATFTAEFETVFDNPTTTFATFADWNSWIALDLCSEANGDLSYDPSQCASPLTHEFVDTYTDELSRDIEPTVSQGDFYYRLMKSCVADFRAGASCAPASATASTSMVFDATLAAEAERACTYPGQTNEPATPTTGQVFGNVDGIDASTGRAILRGWTCIVGSNLPTTIQVFLGGPAGVGTLQLTTVTNVTAEAAVHAVCQNAVTVPNRFEIDVTDWMGTNAGQTIYVHGLNPQNMLNYFVGNSAHCAVPWPEVDGCQ